MLNIDKIEMEIKEWRIERNKLYPKDFQESLDNYIYRCLNVENIAIAKNERHLFQIENREKNVFPVFDYMQNETLAERERGHKIFAIYSFNNPKVKSIDSSVRVEISAQSKPLESDLKLLKRNGKEPKGMVDIEFFEKASLAWDSKNYELTEFIKEYMKDSRLSLRDIEDFGSLKSLRDKEKMHTQFLIYGKNEIIPVYIGIGNNQPYGISEKKGRMGKNRFYRYSLINNLNIEQTSKIKFGNRIEFEKQDIVALENTCSGNTFALHFKKGMLIKKNNSWKKADLIQPIKKLNPAKEIYETSLSFLKEKLKNIFPSFEDYSQVYYDPLERTKSFSLLKSKIHLQKKGLLDYGYPSEKNIASALYRHGCNPVLRLKPSLLLMYYFIETEKINELILNTLNNEETKPK